MSDRRFSKFSQAGGAPKSALPGGMYLAGPAVGAFADGDRDGDRDNAEEVQRAFDISVIGAAGAGAATFLPPAAAGEAELAAAWDAWLAGQFASQLGPAFCRVHAAVGEMRIGEVLRADRDVDAALGEEGSRRSLAAARAFLEGREAIRHMPQFVRLSEAIRKADSPGHVTTLFAMQAGLFHLPRLGALLAYAYFEWLGGVMAARCSLTRDMKTFERLHPGTAEVVRSLLRGEIDGDGAGEASIFCVD